MKINEGLRLFIIVLATGLKPPFILWHATLPKSALPAMSMRGCMEALLHRVDSLNHQPLVTELCLRLLSPEVCMWGLGVGLKVPTL